MKIEIEDNLKNYDKLKNEDNLIQAGIELGLNQAETVSLELNN